MTLKTQLEKELTSRGAGAATYVVRDGERGVHCEVIEQDALALSFMVLRLETPELATADAARLQRLGAALSSRVTYLLEPIGPVEVDNESCVVQLRSIPPQRGEDGRSYYEILVRRGGEIALSRYLKPQGAPRQRVPATVTRQVLLRLVEDIGGVLDETV